MANQPAAKNIVAEVATILGIEKFSWSANVKLCNQCLSDGFTREDIRKAAYNMMMADKKYQSIYSLFNKIDYWYNQTPEETKAKGVW